ncbi:MAG: dTMP kinase [Tissierellia bacterium]|nr:dTMP kinase [Tissierellia bacterium]
MENHRPLKGKFFVLEGSDGSGKSTVATGLYRELTARGHRVLKTREPGGSPIGEEIRELLLNPQNSAMAPRTEALLYAASRAQHVAQVILPALEEGKVVLCERYIFSSIVYQGVGRNLGIEEIFRLNQWATGALVPHLTLYLDTDNLKREERLKKRFLGEEPDRLELDGDFLERVHRGYGKVLEVFPHAMKIIDATQSPEAVLKQCVAALEKEL